MFQRFWRDTSANMGVMFAVAITLGLLASTIVIDAGSLYYERRNMQSAVDLAAISAATDLSKAQQLAQETLIDAGMLAPGSSAGLTVIKGRYDPSIADPTKRFLPGTQPHNAVDVTLTKQGTLYFGQHLIDPPAIGVSGTAARIPEASFSVGSRLASVNAGILNSVLGGLLGTTLSLSVVDYNSLVGARIELLRFLDFLAQEMGVTVGTYDDLLQMNATAGQIANLALGDARAVAGLKLTARDLLGAAAAIANGSRVINLGLDAGIDKLADLKIALAIGEPPNRMPWFQFGPVNTTVRTVLGVRCSAPTLIR